MTTYSASDLRAISNRIRSESDQYIVFVGAICGVIGFAVGYLMGAA